MMKILTFLFAILTFNIAAAQTDTLSDKNNPAKQVATPNAGAVDQTPTGQKQAYKIEPEKNAETVTKIKRRTEERKRKSVKKSNSTTSKS